VYGNNPTRPRETSSGAMLTVQEVFNTIQGEGPHAGLPATFIRLWGCHLKCWFCDTDFESSRNEMSVQDLVSRCADGRGGGELVVLTGGEPMRQTIAPLCSALITAGLRVQIETAGSFWFDGDDEHAISHCMSSPELSIVVSPKTPSVDPLIATYANAWKYVVNVQSDLDPRDGLPVVNYQSTVRGWRARPLARPPQGTPPRCVYVQPMDEGDAARNTANRAHAVDLARRFGYRVSLQQHKLLGLP